jgi:protein ImuA
MSGLHKQRALGTLRARIAALEKRPPLAGSIGSPRPRQAAGAGLFASPPGLVHEIYAEDTRDTATALGFAFGQARGLLRPQRPALFFMQLTHEGRQQGLPYGAGLAAFGLDPQALVVVSVKTVPELLWAVEEALACQAVAAVLAGIGGTPKGLDFTASRRLALRAASARTSLFLLRSGAGREASAAQLRWHVTPALSGEKRFDPQAPGAPRWQVTLEKSRIEKSHETHWLVSWNDGFEFRREPGNSPAGRIAGAAALPGAQPAALGERLLQTA